MRAIVAERPGGPEVLTVAERPTPEPKAGQVRIRHEAVGINYIDTYFRSGLYKAPFPLTPGAEAAGVVEAVGEGVTRFQVGDRAAYIGGQGAYAEAAVVSENTAVRLPEGMDSRLAAASLLKGMTAEFLLRRCAPAPAGSHVLVHAAAGGVGQILVQWGAHLGLKVIAGVGSADKAEIVRGLGAAEVILTDEEDVPARVREITGGRGVPAVYDGVGAATFEGSLASLARRGVLATFGNASGPAPAFPPSRLSSNGPSGGSLYVTRPTLFDYVATPEELDESAGALFAVLASGAVKIAVGRTWPLAEARAAHEALEARQTTGSSLLLP